MIIFHNITVFTASDQINAAFMSIRDVFQRPFKKILGDLKLLNGRLVYGM